MSQRVVQKGIKLLLLGVLLFSASHAEAILVRVRLPRESATVGTIITAPLSVETDTAVNALSVTLQFPDFIKPLSVSYAGTPVSLWIVPPTIDVTQNTLTAEGIILGSGFVGNADMFSIQMRVVGPGEGYVTLLEGSLLARDGKGTNILNSLDSSARFVASIPSEGVETLPVAQEITDSDLLAPKITRYSSRIKNVQDFFVEGETYPNAVVHVGFALDNMTEIFETTSTATGHFDFKYPTPTEQAQLLKASGPLRPLAAAFTINGLEYEFWVWAEKDGLVTPKTTPLGVALEGFSWGTLSIAIDPSTLLIVIAALLGLIITSLFGVAIIRAINRKNQPPQP